MTVHDDWALTSQRLAVHLPSETAVAADVHLGYDLARQRRGEAVPATGPEELLAALDAVRRQHAVSRFLAAGDLVEDGSGVALLPELCDHLRDRDIEFVGVTPGNHDRPLQGTTVPLFPDGIDLGGWRVLHGDGRLPEGRVVHGHVHPLFRWGADLAAPCYLVGPNRLILPAFSRDAAGGNVVGKRQWHGLRCGVIVGDRVLDFGELASLERRRRGRC